VIADRSLKIVTYPRVSGGEPVVWGTSGTRVTALLNRIDAGDSIEEVAKDFGCDRGALELLVELREAIRPRLYAAYNGMIGETSVVALVEASVAVEARHKAKAAFEAAGLNSTNIKIEHVPLPIVGEGAFHAEEIT